LTRPSETSRLHPVLAIPWEAMRRIQADGAFQLAAALSYYTILSLAPLVLVTVALAGLVFGREAVEGEIVSQLRDLAGEPGAELVQTVIRNASADQEGGVVSLLVGLLSLLLGATTVFVQLQRAMNEIWSVEARPERSGPAGILRFLRKRLLSHAMVVAIGFHLLVSLLLSAALTALGTWTSSTGIADTFPVVLQVLQALVSMVVFALLFALIFKYLPDVELGWRDVAYGAAITALLFTGGKFLIGYYLGRAGIGSAYGAAGSVVVFLVWVYYAALILFFGAEITQVRTERMRGRVKAEEHAVPATSLPESDGVTR
jgi:membrane protein